jgi:hypothetical protein
MAKVKLSADDCTLIKIRLQFGEKYQQMAWQLPDGEPIRITTAGQDSYIDRPSKYLVLMQGRYWESVNSPTGVLRTSNKILPKEIARHALITGGETTIFCEPRGSRWQGGEEEVSSHLKSEWDAAHFDEELGAALWDTACYAFGVVENGWRFERGDEKLVGHRGDPVVEEGAEPFDTANPDFGEQEIPEGISAEDYIAQADMDDEDIKWGEPTFDGPFVERFSPRELIVDPCTRKANLSDARYAFRVRYEGLDECKANSAYENTEDLHGDYYAFTDSKNLTPSAPLDSSIRESEAKVTLYDGYMWHWMGKGARRRSRFLHVVMCKEHDKPLLSEDAWCLDERSRPLFADSPYPYSPYFTTKPDNDVFYQVPRIEQAEGLQLAYDESSHMLNEHRRKSGRQFITSKGAFEPDEKEKIEEGVDMAIVEVNNYDTASRITALPTPPVQPEVYNEMQMTDPEMDRALGVSQMQEAVASKRKMLKAEVDAMANQGQSRISGEQETFNAWRSVQAMRLLALLMRFADRKREYSYNQGGKTTWGAMNNEDLRGTNTRGELEPIGIQYRVKVTVDAEAHRNKQADQQLKIKMLQALEPFAKMPDTDDPTVPMVSLKPLLKNLVDSFDIPNSKDCLAPTLSPEEKKQKQQEAAQKQMMAMIQAKMAGQQPGGGGGQPENNGGPGPVSSPPMGVPTR